MRRMKWSTLALVAIVGLAAGCAPWAGGRASGAGGPEAGSGGGGSAPVPAGPEVEVSPSPVRFAETKIGSFTELEVTIAVRPDAPRAVQVLDVAVSGDLTRSFVVSTGTFPRQLSPGQALAFRLRFTPLAEGASTATLVIQNDLVAAVLVPVSGEASGADLRVAPAPISFASAAAGSGPTSLRVELRNAGRAARMVGTIAFTGDGGGQLSLAGLPALPLALPAGAAATFEVVLHPGTEGILAGELAVLSDDPVRPDLRVPISGRIERPATVPFDEFQVNRSSYREQERPSLAALPHAPFDGTVAVAMFFDRSHTATTGLPKNQWAVAPILQTGRAEGTDDTTIAKTSPGSIYNIIHADVPARRYASPARYEVSNDSSARTIWLSTIGARASDLGGAMVLDSQSAISDRASAEMLDLAIDPGTGNRLVIWRIAGRRTDGMDPTIYGRLMSRPDVADTASPTAVKLTPIFQLSSAPRPEQRTPRIAYDGTRFVLVFEELGVVKGRFFALDATPAGADFVISEGTGGALDPQLVSSEGTGETLVVWQQGEIVGRLVRRDGSLGSTARLNALAGGAHPSPAVAPDGTLLVVWDGPDASGRGIYARRFSPVLAPLAPEEPVNQVTDGEQVYPAAVWVPLARHFLVAWTGVDESLTGVKGRYLE